MYLIEGGMGGADGDSAEWPSRAGGALPFFGLLLSPMIAATAMSLGSALGNALRLRRLHL